MGGDIVDLDPKSRASLHLISFYAFSKLRSFLPSGAWDGGKLTEREIDALKWTARGKTGSDIHTSEP